VQLNLRPELLVQLEDLLLRFSVCDYSAAADQWLDDCHVLKWRERQGLQLEGRDGDATADAAEGLVGDRTIENSGEGRCADLWALRVNRPNHVKVVFDNDRAVLLDKSRWQLSGDQSTRLLLRGGALNENARDADHEPFVTVLDVKIRLVVPVVGTIDKPTVGSDGFSPHETPRPSVPQRSREKLDQGEKSGEPGDAAHRRGRGMVVRHAYRDLAFPPPHHRSAVSEGALYSGTNHRREPWKSNEPVHSRPARDRQRGSQALSVLTHCFRLRNRLALPGTASPLSRVPAPHGIRIHSGRL
jgi:hypothetical protein